MSDDGKVLEWLHYYARVLPERAYLNMWHGDGVKGPEYWVGYVQGVMDLYLDVLEKLKT